MKTLMIVLLLISNSAMAETNLKKYWDQFYPGQKCIPSQALGLYLLKAIEPKVYETHGDPTAGARNVIIKTTAHTFTTQGAIRDVMIRYFGARSLKTNSGFNTVYDLVEECK